MNEYFFLSMYFQKRIIFHLPIYLISPFFCFIFFFIFFFWDSFANDGSNVSFLKHKKVELTAYKVNYEAWISHWNFFSLGENISSASSFAYSHELISFLCKIHIKFDFFFVFFSHFLFYFFLGTKASLLVCLLSVLLLLLQPHFRAPNSYFLYQHYVTPKLSTFIQSFLLILSFHLCSFIIYKYGDVIRFAFGTVFILYSLRILFFLMSAFCFALMVN